MSKPEPRTEDDYLVSATVDEFARADEEALDDDENADFEDSEQVINSQIIQEISTYLKEAIVEQDSVDQIDLTETAKMTPTQQIAVHKLVKSHLVTIQGIINDKIKEG